MALPSYREIFFSYLNQGPLTRAVQVRTTNKVEQQRRPRSSDVLMDIHERLLDPIGYFIFSAAIITEPEPGFHRVSRPPFSSSEGSSGEQWIWRNVLVVSRSVGGELAAGTGTC